MRTASALFLAILLIVSSAIAADPTVLDAKTAKSHLESGAMTLFDVRSPGEWRKTGVPRGATPLTIHPPDGMAGFVGAVTRAVDGNKDKPVAVICATGRRSTAAAEALREAGFTNVINVREGMMGNRSDGPGWLSRDLPLDPCKKC